MPTGNILVVDDEKLIRWSLRECLQEQGYDVSAVETGGEALGKVDEEPFDLVLLDYKLPDTNGLEVLGRLHRTHPDLPVVMMSGFPEEEVLERFEGAELAGVLHKPFGGQDLVALIRRATE